MVPASEAERQIVRTELTRILATSHFTSSKRYPAFLQYVVERTLGGELEDLKERTIGFEVFHRKPDYDTNSDTIVRFTAGEVRKRLALYYYENQADQPVRIQLSPGSYVPEFLLREPTPAEQPIHLDSHGLSTLTNVSVEGPVPAVQANLARRPHSIFRSKKFVAGCLLVVLLFSLIAAARWLLVKDNEAALNAFWQPVRGSTAPVILCTGGVVFSTLRENGMIQATKTDDYPYISVQSTAAVARIAELLGRGQTRYIVQSANTTTLTDLREHPTVFVGAYNNEWTMRILGKLRYRFGSDSDVAIVDTTDPSVAWRRPKDKPKDREDYAIVARFRDPDTDQIVVVLAGISKNGTEAAAQFVTSARYLSLLDAAQRKNLATKNIEFVLRTDVIGGKTGAPTLEAVHTW